MFYLSRLLFIFCLVISYVPNNAVSVPPRHDEKESALLGSSDSSRNTKEITAPVPYSQEFFLSEYDKLKSDLSYSLGRSEDINANSDVETALRGAYSRFEELPRVMRWSPQCWKNTVAIIDALLTSGMYTILLMDNGGVAGMLGVPITYDSWNIPMQNLIFAPVMGALTLPGFTQASLSVVKGFTEPTNIHRKSTEHGKPSWRTYILMFPAVAFLEVYSGYTWITVNFFDLEPTTYSGTIKTTFKALSVICGIPWTFNLLRSTYVRLLTSYNDCKRQRRRYPNNTCQSKRKKRQNNIRRIQEKIRCELLDRLAAVGRKLQHKPDFALELWQKINAYNSYTQKEMVEIDSEISSLGDSLELATMALEEGESKSTSRERGVTVESIQEQQDIQNRLERRTALLTLRHLYNALSEKEERIYSLDTTFHKKPSKQFAQWLCGDDIPWNKIGRTAGAITLGLAATSLTYQSAMIMNEVEGFGFYANNSGGLPTYNDTSNPWNLTSEEESVYGPAITMSVFYNMYFLGHTMDAVGALFNRLIGHNPMNMGDVNLHYSVFRGVLSSFLMAQSACVMWPFSVVGGEGMYYGIGSWFPPILPSITHYWTLIPAMVAWGALEFNMVEPWYQRLVSSAGNWSRKIQSRWLARKFNDLEVRGGKYLDPVDEEELREKIEDLKKGDPIGTDETLENLEDELAHQMSLKKILKKLRHIQERTAQQKGMNFIQEARRWINDLRGPILQPLKERLEKKPENIRSNFIIPLGDEASKDEPESTAPRSRWQWFKEKICGCFGRYSRRQVGQEIVGEDAENSDDDEEDYGYIPRSFTTSRSRNHSRSAVRAVTHGELDPGKEDHETKSYIEDEEDEIVDEDRTGTHSVQVAIAEDNKLPDWISGQDSEEIKALYRDFIWDEDKTGFALNHERALQRIILNLPAHLFEEPVTRINIPSSLEVGPELFKALYRDFMMKEKLRETVYEHAEIESQLAYLRYLLDEEEESGDASVLPEILRDLPEHLKEMRERYTQATDEQYKKDILEYVRIALKTTMTTAFYSDSSDSEEDEARETLESLKEKIDQAEQRHIDKAQHNLEQLSMSAAAFGMPHERTGLLETEE